MLNTNTTPTVSIIMPTYNRAKYISETIGSVLNQTYKHWELIIIDDGSDDNTEEIVAQLNDERIQFYKAGRTGIVGKLKNIGIEKTSGEFIAFIDSDDLWATEKLEKQVAALQQYVDAGFSITGGFNFKNQVEPVDYFFKREGGIKYGEVLISFFKSELPAYTQALMLRRSCIAVAGVFNESKSFADVEFILNLASHYEAVILYEPLLYRRLHDTNDSGANWEKRYYEGMEIINLYKKKLPGSIARNAMYRLHINFGEDYLRYKVRNKAIIHFFKAWRNKPLSFTPIKKTGKALLRYFK